MDEANAAKQKLSLAEECVLVNFILNSADCGFPMTHCSIESYANAILQVDWIKLPTCWIRMDLRVFGWESTQFADPLE